jgi:hypothetical protein
MNPEQFLILVTHLVKERFSHRKKYAPFLNQILLYFIEGKLIHRIIKLKIFSSDFELCGCRISCFRKGCILCYFLNLRCLWRENPWCRGLKFYCLDTKVLLKVEHLKKELLKLLSHPVSGELYF